MREIARALTGWEATRVDGWWDDFHFDPAYHDAGTKTIFGNTGSFDWRDAAHLCVSHPLHRSFLVRKLWSYIPTRSRAPTGSRSPACSSRAASGSARWWRRSSRIPVPTRGRRWSSPRSCTWRACSHPPAGHRMGSGSTGAIGRGSGSSSRRMSQAGPTTSGSTRARSTLAGSALAERFDPGSSRARRFWDYDPTETAEQALDTAIAFCGNPQLSAETQAPLLAFAEDCVAGPLWLAKAHLPGDAPNALRQLILASPDLQVS